MSKKAVYHNLTSIAKKVGLVAPHKTGLSIFIESKLYGVELFKNKSLESLELLSKAKAEETKEGKIILDRTGKYLSESMVYYEAYLNAVYSFLEILSSITPHFYDTKKIGGDFPSRSFKDQRAYLRKHHAVDQEFSDYVKEMKLLNTLENDRHAVIHYVSAFLGFGENGEIIRLVMPNKSIDFWAKSKQYVDVENEIIGIWEELFRFLEFYVKHFVDKEMYWISESRKVYGKSPR